MSHEGPPEANIERSQEEIDVDELDKLTAQTEKEAGEFRMKTRVEGDMSMVELEGVIADGRSRVEKIIDEMTAAQRVEKSGKYQTNRSQIILSGIVPRLRASIQDIESRTQSAENVLSNRRTSGSAKPDTFRPGDER